MILVFDSDDAGINAAKRSIKLFLKEGVDTRILVLPQKNDPDSFVMKHGPEAFNNLAQEAKTVMQFLLQVSIDSHGLSVEGRINILEDMKPYLVRIKDAAVRSMYVKELAETLKIDEKAVLEKVREHFSKQNMKKTSLLEPKMDETRPDSDRREGQVISMMLNFPQLITQMKDTGVVDYFYSEKLKRIAKKIITVDPERDAFVTMVMAEMESNEDRELIAGYAMEDLNSEEDIQTQAASIIKRIIRVRKKQENKLTNKIISAEKDCDAELMELLAQKQKEIRLLHDQ